MPPKKKSTPVEITSTRHKDKRTNIPTEELRDFVTDAETTPKTMLYPRDPSLDPQLVWRGKDEQDAEALAVPVVPIYIQEKVHPQCIIEALPRIDQTEPDAPTLFSDFNGGPKDFDQKVDFYKYEQNWSNRLILGDSLLVMASLAEKEGLKGRVQTIYIDPPYGIKFGSNWQVSTRKRDVRDGKAEDASRQPEQVKAFRDTWELGIHSYLAYLRDRFVVSRELLSDGGSLFVQIGDQNVHLIRNILDEVFGSENFISQITVRKTTSEGSSLIGSTCDFLVWYGKLKSVTKFRPIYQPRSEGAEDRYDQKLEDGRLYRLDNITSSRPAGEGDVTSFSWRGTLYNPGTGTFKTTEPGLRKLDFADRLQASSKGKLNYRRMQDDFGFAPIANLWTDISGAVQSRSDPKVYVVQTSGPVIERCLLMTTDPGDLVLDPTCGSGTTAYVAEQWGRRWITCDTSRVALALARTRLMSARFPYYLLADSSDGIRKEAELTRTIPPAHQAAQDIRKGFVYKRVPHVTLKSIANNPEIKSGMSREEIDAAVARHTDTETLFDQPYEDNKKVRVCGPFSVESLSPYRVLSTADDSLEGTACEQEAKKEQDFAAMILANLQKAGVQNTIKNERLTFDTLEPYAGAWLNATGTYTDATGKSHRAAVSLGPEHGTVGPNQVKEAAKEAVQGIGFDTLVVCGFAFDPHVSEETKRFGNLQVLIARMNPDLSMGNELLKKTGAGNLFMVFGEPDIDLNRSSDGNLQIKIKGVDVYDPTTGEVRKNSTDDIACWFIDTEYNGESFFVRHAYFTGKDQPYEKLKRALRAEIDDAAWSTLYSTISRPFAEPASGKIAVKVINHYGDEVLKIFPV